MVAYEDGIVHLGWRGVGVAEKRIFEVAFVMLVEIQCSAGVVVVFAAAVPAAFETVVAIVAGIAGAGLPGVVGMELVVPATA